MVAKLEEQGKNTPGDKVFSASKALTHGLLGELLGKIQENPDNIKFPSEPLGGALGSTLLGTLCPRQLETSCFNYWRKLGPVYLSALRNNKIG